jgi:type I restriction enzyme S subunit
MREWRDTYIGDQAEIVLGGTPSTQVSRYWGGDVRWMSSGDVHRRFIDDVPGRITIDGLLASNATLVEPPAVAIALAGQGKTRGTAALVRTELSTNQSVALLKGRANQLDTGFLFHNLDARYEELRRSSSGGGRGGLSKKILGSLPIDLPPIDEQRRIAEILDTADEAIQYTERRIMKRLALLEALASDLLSGRALIDSSDLGASADPPPLQPLGDRVKVLQGFAFSSRFFTRDPGMPLVRIRDLERRDTAINYVGPYDERFLIDRGALLVGMDGDFVVSRWTGERALLNQRVCRVLSATADVDERYLFHALKPEINHVHRITPQTTVRHLNESGIRSCRVLAVDVDEQRHIANVLDALDDLIAKDFSNLGKRREQRAGLACDLLSGRVRAVAA